MGGKQKGSSIALSVVEKLQNLNCDPIVGLVKIAEDKKEKTEVRAFCYHKLAKFIHPELKSTEHRVNVSGTIDHTVGPKQLLADRIAELLANRGQASSNRLDAEPGSGTVIDAVAQRVGEAEPA